MNESDEAWPHRFPFIEPCRVFDAVFICLQAKSACLPHRLLQIKKEGMPVKRDGQVPVVHCFFTAGGEKLRELVRQSLRLYIERNLQNAAKI